MGKNEDLRPHCICYVLNFCSLPPSRIIRRRKTQKNAKPSNTKKENSHVKDSNPCHVKPLNARLPSKPTKKEMSNPLLKLAEKRRLTSKNPFWLNGNVKFLTNDLNKNF